MLLLFLQDLQNEQGGVIVGLDICIWQRLISNLIHIMGYYEGHLESKERFAIQRYLLIIGKKKNMQVLGHTFTYFPT